MSIIHSKHGCLLIKLWDTIVSILWHNTHTNTHYNTNNITVLHSGTNHNNHNNHNSTSTCIFRTGDKWKTEITTHHLHSLSCNLYIICQRTFIEKPRFCSLTVHIHACLLTEFPTWIYQPVIILKKTLLLLLVEAVKRLQLPFVCAALWCIMTK